MNIELLKKPYNPMIPFKELAALYVTKEELHLIETALQLMHINVDDNTPNTKKQIEEVINTLAPFKIWFCSYTHCKIPKPTGDQNA